MTNVEWSQHEKILISTTVLQPIIHELCLYLQILHIKNWTIWWPSHKQNMGLAPLSPCQQNYDFMAKIYDQSFKFKPQNTFKYVCEIGPRCIDAITQSRQAVFQPCLIVCPVSVGRHLYSRQATQAPSPPLWHPALAAARRKRPAPTARWTQLQRGTWIPSAGKMQPFCINGVEGVGKFCL